MLELGVAGVLWAWFVSDSTHKKDFLISFELNILIL